MFDPVDEDEEEDYGSFVPAIAAKKKATVMPDFLGGDSDDEDEFKPKALSKKP